MDDTQKESHESYGMLRIGRSTGHNTVLFGSSIPHHHTITLSIHPGEVVRNLNHDQYHGKHLPFIEVEMSQAQYAEAITSMNMGSGVPVTVRHFNGKDMEKPTFTNKRVQFEQEFKKSMQDLEKRLSRLTEDAEDVLMNKKSLNKNDRNTILNELNALKRELASNIPFMASSYNEQMDKTAQETKAEVEAFTINKLNQLGLEKWHDQMNKSDPSLNENPFLQTPIPTKQEESQ